MPDEEPIDVHVAQAATLEALKLIQTETAQLFVSHPQAGEDFPQTLRLLSHYLWDRCDTVTLLLSWNLLWDAEMILRAFYETGARILFLTTADEQNRQALVNEFWSGLRPMNDRRRARKAAMAMSAFSDDPRSTAIFAALQDPNFFEIEPVASKNARKLLEQKWSFPAIIEQLSKSNLPKAETIRAFLHAYGLASHLLHADQAALDLMIDRSFCRPKVRKLLAASHAVRVMADQAHLTFLCAETMRRAFDIQFKDADVLRAVMQKADALRSPYLQRFYDAIDEENAA